MTTENNQSTADTQLSNCLDYYCKEKSPTYAVLVTGPWGIGKTYQIKKIIPENECYYVSLYGIDSVDKIHEAVRASPSGTQRFLDLCSWAIKKICICCSKS